MYSDVITVILAILRSNLSTKAARQDKPLIDYVAAIYNLDTGGVYYAPRKEWPKHG